MQNIGKICDFLRVSYPKFVLEFCEEIVPFTIFEHAHGHFGYQEQFVYIINFISVKVGDVDFFKTSKYVDLGKVDRDLMFGENKGTNFFPKWLNLFTEKEEMAYSISLVGAIRA